MRDSGGWALRETLWVGHLGRVGLLWGWALPVGHSRDERGADRARRRVTGEEKSSF